MPGMRRTSSPIISAVLVLWVSSTPPLHAAEKWLGVRSKNFLLVGNASESSIKRVGRELEEFRSALASIFPRVNQESSIGTTVVVFKDDAAFKPFKPLYEGKAANVAGYFQSGQDVNFIALTADSPSPHVVYHEFVHSLTRDAALPLPPWIGEGLAEVYSMFELTGKEIMLGRAVAEHVELLKQQQMLPLDVLLAVEHNSVYYNEKTKQGMFYAQSWASVHYLLFGNRRQQFGKYLNLVSGGRSIESAFREAFETDYKTLEEEIRRYVQERIAWPAIRVKLQEKLDFEKEMKPAALSEAQAQYYLGDLMLHSDRLDLAESQLQKALALDPKLAPAHASLAMLRLRQDRRDEAAKLLAQAVEGDSTNHLAHFYYARLLTESIENAPAEERNSTLSLARRHTEKTIELAPRFTEASDMLGYIALVARDGTKEAQAAVIKAIEFAPGRLELRLRLAELMFANNELAQAQSILTIVKNSASDDVIRYRAERMLADVQNRRSVEKELEAYRARRTAVGDAADNQEQERGGGAAGTDERLLLARSRVDPGRDAGTEVIETAKPQGKAPEGLRIAGLLSYVDCTRGLTLRLRLGNGIVELHTDSPQQVEFMSYVTTIQDTFACGAMKPEVPVEIVYRRSANPAYLGEPLRVDFVKRD
jgi:tetratricopeptide (TPR) repeat protein